MLRIRAGPNKLWLRRARYVCFPWLSIGWQPRRLGKSQFRYSFSFCPVPLEKRATDINGNVKLSALMMDELVVGFRNLLNVTDQKPQAGSPDERTLHNVIFGDIWFSGNAEARLRLVDVLTQTTYRSLLRQVDRTKGTTTHLKSLIDLWIPWTDNIKMYRTPVLRILHPYIAQEPLHCPRRPGWNQPRVDAGRRGFRVSVRKFSSRK